MTLPLWSRGERALAEPAWVKVAHAVLLYGAPRAREQFWPTQEAFWLLVRGLNGKGMSRNTGGRAISNGPPGTRSFFARDPLRFGPGAGYVVGVALGRESLRTALFDANGEIAAVHDPEELHAGKQDGVTLYENLHAAEAEPLPGRKQLEMAPDALIGRIIATVKAMCLRAVSDAPLLVEKRLPLLGISVGWPTPINRWTKVPTRGPLIDLRWKTSDAIGNELIGLDERVRSRLNGLEPWRSHAINAANALALSATFDACRQSPDLETDQVGEVILALRLGGGIGAGTVVIGTSSQRLPRSRFIYSRVLEGTGGYAGELGHWQIPEEDVADVFGRGMINSAPPEPIECTCGRERCLQSFASATALVPYLRKLNAVPDDILAGDSRGERSILHERLKESDDPRVRDALKNFGRLIGRSLSAPVLMLNPSKIVVGGSLALEALTDGIRHESDRWGAVGEDPPQLIPLSPDESRFAVARGAALATFRGQLYRRIDRPATVMSELTAKLDAADVRGWDDRAG